jgi:hypothetical protein
MALPIIVLTAAPLLADAAVPFVFSANSLMTYALLLTVLGLIPVVLIEGFVLRRRLRLRTGRAFATAAVANVVSTAIGLVPQYLYPELLPEHPVDNLYYLPLLAAFTLLLLFGVSLVSETAVTRWMLGTKAKVPQGEVGSRQVFSRPPVSVLRGVFDANLASYVFLATVLGVTLAWMALEDRTFVRERYAHPFASLRIINTSEIKYSSTYTTGFSASLSALGGPSACPKPTEAAACLIDPQLASGERAGYRYVYKPGPRNGKGEITSYSITARPVQGVGHGNFYYTDQTGVIRMNNTAPATATDPPYAG